MDFQGAIIIFNTCFSEQVFYLLLCRLSFHLFFASMCVVSPSPRSLPINSGVISYRDYKVQYAITSDFLPLFMLLRDNKIVLIVSEASFLVFQKNDSFTSCRRIYKLLLGNIYWIKECWNSFYAISIASQIESIYQSLVKTEQNNHLKIVPVLHSASSAFQTGKGS